MSIILEVVVALFAAKIIGGLFRRIGFVELLGPIVAGFIFGPILGWLAIENIEPFGHIGLILILFLAGFEEFNIKDILKDKVGIGLTGVLGAIIPFLMGWGLGLLFGYDNLQSLFLGGMLGATSVSISIGTLLSSGKMNTRVGRYALSSSIIDDVLSLFIFIVVSGIAISGGFDFMEILKVFGQLLLFTFAFVVFMWLSPKIISFFEKLRIEEAEFAISIVIVLALALLSEELGLSSVVGAFVAGVMLSRIKILKTKINIEKFKAVSLGFFVPLFFVWVGMQLEVDVSVLGWLSLAILLVAIASKVVAAWLCMKPSKMSFLESTAVGFARIPRGEVTITMLILGKSLGIIDNGLFGSVFVMIFAVTILTPILLKPFLARIK